eukprot:1810540-Prorocentrum_lima.AAC.1
MNSDKERNHLVYWDMDGPGDKEEDRVQFRIFMKKKKIDFSDEHKRRKVSQLKTTDRKPEASK